jgi:hypothetical protein
MLQKQLYPKLSYSRLAKDVNIWVKLNFILDIVALNLFEKNVKLYFPKYRCPKKENNLKVCIKNHGFIGPLHIFLLNSFI